MARFKQIDWSLHGDEIKTLYAIGNSVRDVIKLINAKHSITYKSGTLTNFLGRHKLLRSKRDAQKIAKSKIARACAACSQQFQPINYNQRWCDTCTGAKKYTRRLKAHGKTAPQLEAMLEEQQGCCKICHVFFEGGLDTNRKKTLHIDHDHTTGVVRGLVCPRCNLGLSFIDQHGWVESAKLYISSAPKS